jgi:integrase
MLLEAFLVDVYVPLKLRGRSPETVRLLRHAITHFGRWLGRPATLEDFDDLVVARYLTARAETLQPNSVARERSALVALWNMAQARGLVRCRPCIAPELIPETIPRAFTVDELSRLWQACGEARGWIGPIPAGVWCQALCGALFYTGERITALLSVPPDSWKSPWLAVPAASRKGSRKPMVYELPPHVATLLDRASQHDGPVLIWYPATEAALRKRWHRITRAAGLGDGPDVQFHALRRSFASWLDVAGGDSQRALGHASERTTRRYLDPRITGAGQPADWTRLPRIWPDAG